MQISKSLICGLAVMAGLTATSPAALAGGNYGAVMGSYVVPDSKRDTDNGFGGTLLFGHNLTDAISGEVNVFGHQAKLDLGNDLTSYGGGLDLKFCLGGKSVHPFLLLGLGGEKDKIGTFEDGSPFLDVGVGVLAGLFRGEIKGYALNDIDSIAGRNHAFDLRLNLGLQFGGAAARAVVAALEPEPAPAPAPKAAVVDSDHDGVADSADRCPGTPAGVEVDARGCANISKVVLKGVNFGVGSAKLLPAASDTLRSVASAMKADPKLKVEVGGYTDSVGDAAKNLGLSTRRAQAVKAFLVGEGVAANRLSTKGYGQADPADSNATPAGRANNRRVGFKITAQ